MKNRGTFLRFVASFSSSRVFISYQIYYGPAFHFNSMLFRLIKIMGATCESCTKPEDDFARQKKQSSESVVIRSLPFSNLYSGQALSYKILGEWNYTEEPKQMDGEGVIFSECYYYEGQIQKGKGEGKGKIIWSEEFESQYEGKVSNNKPNGKGKFKNDKLQFEGEWWEGTPKSGTLKIKNKKYHIENFVLQESGKGQIKMKLPNKCEYEGHIIVKRDNVYFDGKGTMKFPDSSTYSGYWRDGKMHGKGLYKWNNREGTKFDGNYENGLKEGNGKYYINQNKFLQGEWNKGKKNGHFKVVEKTDYREEVIYECVFVDDQKKSAGYYLSSINQ